MYGGQGETMTVYRQEAVMMRFRSLDDTDRSSVGMFANVDARMIIEVAFLQRLQPAHRQKNCGLGRPSQGKLLLAPVVPAGAMQVELPMRIACYCRHQNEKLGFQFVFPPPFPN